LLPQPTTDAADVMQAVAQPGTALMEAAQGWAQVAGGEVVSGGTLVVVVSTTGGVVVVVVTEGGAEEEEEDGQAAPRQVQPLMAALLKATATPLAQVLPRQSLALRAMARMLVHMQFQSSRPLHL
jgi:hypothetical protein